MRNGFIDKHFSKRNNTNFDDSSSSSEEFHVGYYENLKIVILVRKKIKVQIEKKGILLLEERI